MEGLVTISTKEYKVLVESRTLVKVLRNEIRKRLAETLKHTNEQDTNSRYFSEPTNFVESCGISVEQICRLFGWEEDYLETLSDAKAIIRRMNIEKEQEDGKAE